MNTERYTRRIGIAISAFGAVGAISIALWIINSMVNA